MTREADALIGILEERALCRRITLFVPHEEGRGVLLQSVRFSEDDLIQLSPDARARINFSLYRSERDWLASRAFSEETRRMLLLSLRPDTIDRYEAMSPGEIIAETEALDDEYYRAFPTLLALADRYGDPEGRQFYRQRDLFYHYRRLFAKEHSVAVYDVADERRSGSRRY